RPLRHRSSNRRSEVPTISEPCRLGNMLTLAFSLSLAFPLTLAFSFSLSLAFPAARGLSDFVVGDRPRGGRHQGEPAGGKEALQKATAAGRDGLQDWVKGIV